MTHFTIKSSDHIPRHGGTPILRETIMIKNTEELLLMFMRECELLYNQLTKANIKGEHSPCLMIIMILLQYPISVPLNKPSLTIPICTTEEYAISNFKSP